MKGEVIVKKFALTLIMLNLFCSLTPAQYGGTPVTLKHVYKDASYDGDHATSRVHVRVKTTLQYDGMTPYILESMAYSKVTMKAYGSIQTSYYARTEIRGTATGEGRMPEIPEREIVHYSPDMSAYGGYNESFVNYSFFAGLGFATVTVEIAARGTAREYITNWDDFDEVQEEYMYEHDPWAWGHAWATSTEIKSIRAATDDPDAHDGQN